MKAMRSRTLVVVLVVMALLVPSATTLGNSLPSSYALPGETVFPEGVAVLPGPDYFYVSSTDDGTIFRGQLQQPEADVFLSGGQDGRTAAVGLAVDAERGTLFVSGGATGMVWAYDVNSRQLVGQGANEYESTFINDVTVTPDGAAYFTDSFQPVIYRLSGAGTGEVVFEEWLDINETPIPHQEGFNLNGIVATADGAYLIVVHSSTGTLYRVSTEDGSAVQIDLAEGTVPAGDGLVVRGNTLVVVQNALGQLTTVRMSEDFASGTIWSSMADASFRTPTTAAILGDRLLVVNAQFSARGGTPVLPFSVSSIPVWQLTRVGVH
jgi:Cu-Zn family superoxide dismutase